MSTKRILAIVAALVVGFSGWNVVSSAAGADRTARAGLHWHSELRLKGAKAQFCVRRHADEYALHTRLNNRHGDHRAHLRTKQRVTISGTVYDNGGSNLHAGPHRLSARTSSGGTRADADPQVVIKLHVGTAHKKVQRSYGELGAC